MSRSVLALLVALAACTPPPAVLHPVRSFVSAECEGACAETVEMTYLGVGGFLIRFREDAILTAPFFSTPPLGQVSNALHLAADPARIDERMQALLPDSAVRASVRAILVGHSHYDHLMDVPHIARTQLREAPVYGNETMRRLLAYDSGLLPRLHALEQDAGTFQRPGRWIYPHPDSTVRFMALRSEHAAHALGVKVFRRRQGTDRPHPPHTAWTWAEGETHAFVIDFLDGKKGPPLFRVHYQDAASNPPLGFPPPLEEEAARRFDVAILCAGSFGEVRDYPEGILHRTQPRNVVIGHWENFFQPQTDPLKVIPFTDAVGLVKRVDAVLSDDAERTTPRPGARMRFCVCPPSVSPSFTG